MAKIKEMNVSDLEKELKSKREELRQRRFDVTGSKSKNVKGIRDIKRDIARILTEIKLKNK